MTKLLNHTSLSIAVACLISASAQAASVSENQFYNEIVGKTLVGKRMGMKLRMMFAADGTVSMNARIMSASGTWNFSKNKICTNITKGPRKGKRCSELDALGNGRYKNSDGVILQVE